jgi:hypothetical protein
VTVGLPTAGDRSFSVARSSDGVKLQRELHPDPRPTPSSRQSSVTWQARPGSDGHMTQQSVHRSNEQSASRLDIPLIQISETSLVVLLEQIAEGPLRRILYELTDETGTSGVSMFESAL